MNNKNIKTFFRKLKLFRAEYCLGIMLAGILHTITFAILTLTLLVFTDYIFAFKNRTLKFISITLLIFLIVLFLHKVIKSLQFSLKNTAKLLDSQNLNNSEIFLSAYELVKNTNGKKSGPMRMFLLDRVFDQAAKEILKIKTGSIFPIKLVIKNLFILSGVALTAGAALLIPIKITSVIFNRILHPDSDIPPYSQYSFSIFPENPSVVFGDSLELSLKVSGPTVTKTVLLKTRYNNKIHSVTCFNASSSTFTQKIEKITHPIEFWFTIGKARTKHHTIKLLLRPKIILAKLHIKNPKYTHLPNEDFFLAQNGLKVMRNSNVTLEIFSNRPLASGLLTITDSNKNQSLINSIKTGEKSIAFSWQVSGKASISAKIYDIRGTSAYEPLTFKQFILKDNPPDIVINSPDIFSLATPDAVIEVSGYAEDDIGIKSVNIVKTVSGYRDRIFFLGPDTVSEKFDFSDKLNLLELGLEPGNVIELYAEASDFNPSLDGLALTKIVKIQIISKNAYAEMLRTRTHIDVVLKRYSEMLNAFFMMKKLLEESVETLNLKKDIKTKQQILNKLNTLNYKIFDSIKNLTKEFPIYEMEKEQQKTLKNLYQKAYKNKETFDSLSKDSSAQNISDNLKNLLKKWNESEKEVKQNQENINDLTAYSKIMLDAAQLKKIYIKQQNIVNRLSRFKFKDIVTASPMLKKIASDELKLSEQLQNLQKALWQHASNLNDKFWKLKQDAAEMSERIKILRIPQIIQKAGTSAQNKFASKAYIEASTALEKLKALLQNNEKKSNCISQLASGKLPCINGCGNQSDKFRKNAQQILNSILRKECNKSGSGYGSGISGASGYSTGNSSSMNIPLFGPSRSLGVSGGGSGDGDGKADQSSDSTSKAISVKEEHHSLKQFKLNSENINIEDTPFKYRKAVKNYFSD